MTKHVHADMIKAKVDNIELVVFIKMGNSEWRQTSEIPTCEGFKYFLCLPQHKEACLHWLNGGLVQYKDHKGNFVDEVWLRHEWNPSCRWVQDCEEFRIKPRKDEFSELLSGFSSEEPISNEIKEELIYKLIESVYGSGFLIKFSDIKPELQ